MIWWPVTDGVARWNRRAGRVAPVGENGMVGGGRCSGKETI